MGENKATIRITIDLTAELEQRLEGLASVVGTSMEDTIRDALRVFEYLAERNRDGYELLERKDGVVTPANVFGDGRRLWLEPLIT